MSYEEGFNVTNRRRMEESRIDPRRVAAATCSMFAELIFVHGFVHADPHAGNLLVRPRLDKKSGKPTGNFDMVLLDHGMYRRLDESFRSHFCKLWAGLVCGDDSQAAQGVIGLGLPKSYMDLLGAILIYRIPSSVSVTFLFVLERQTVAIAQL